MYERIWNSALIGISTVPVPFATFTLLVEPDVSNGPAASVRKMNNRSKGSIHSEAQIHSRSFSRNLDSLDIVPERTKHVV